MKTYIDIPQYTTLNEITERNFTLSATQYKTFCIKNSNIKTVADFLERPLLRSDLGIEVGSDCYVDSSNYVFIKTKALQEESYLLNETKDATEYIKHQAFVSMNLKKGDIIISKDSNVGEIVILDKDYPNSMLCGGIYRLPIKKYKLYLLAFIKNDLFRQQIDFIVPRGSTIRHGKTKFLECKIPMPKTKGNDTIRYIELLMQAIINKEIAIREKHNSIINMIQQELTSNQKEITYTFSQPTLNEIMELDRMDSALYTEEFKNKQFLVHNYAHGYKTIKEMGFDISRGQNLQISNIGISIQTKEKKAGFYTLILPNFISKYGTVSQIEYLGNPNRLKTLKTGDIIFGAEGNEKGRSLVIFETSDKTITNIHGITLNHNSDDLTKSIFVKLFLDWYRANGMIDSYAVGGNGGSMAIKYWDFLKFPRFGDKIEKEIVSLYHSENKEYNPSQCNLDGFLNYDNTYNDKSGIHEIDTSMKQLQSKLDDAIAKIADDIEVSCTF
ncbi:MAG: hypothetical protein GXZ03_10030 [Proteiniphilum sp.]|nr:hypothetical protein [Proteiniphilum sp.]